MVTDAPDESPYNSYTYLNAADASPNPAGWYVISTSSSTVAIYLIRAYVRFTTGVTLEVSPTPTQFNLGQNYPNPFNPSTVINYQLSKASQVTLNVYDILGREVAMLVNKLQGPGHYSVDFDAIALPSGVYYYRLTTDGNTSVKKMVLLK
jgi:hypothetical protein